MSDSMTIDSLRQALADAEAQHGPDHFETAQATYRLAIYRQMDGKDGAAEAEALAMRALAIYEKNPPFHRCQAGPLSMLALFHIRKGKKAEAEAMLRRSIELLQEEREDGSGYEDGSGCEDDLQNLGVLLHEQGRYLEAAEFLDRGLRVTERNMGVDYKHLGFQLRPLSRAYIGLHRYDDAIEILQRVLDLDRQHDRYDTDEHGELLEEIAALHAKAGRPEQADEVLREAHRLRVQLDTEIGTDYGHMPYYDSQRKAMENLVEQANVLAARNDFAGAIGLVEKVVVHHASQTQHPVGWQHDLHTKLARWHRELGHFAEAEVLLNQSREYLESKVIPLDELQRQILENRNEPKTPSGTYIKPIACVYSEPLGWVWHELGLLHDKSGRLEDALWDFAKAAEIWKVTHDIVPGFVSTSLLSIAAIHGKRGDWKRAGELMEEALVLERSIQPDSSHVAKLCANLAAARREQGRVAEAAQLRLTAADMLLNNEGPGQLQVLFELNEAGQAFLALRDWSRAMTCFKRSLALLREANPVHKQPIVGLLLNLSNVEIQQQHFAESLPYLREALPICESDPVVLTREHNAVLRRLTESLVACGLFDEAENVGLRWLAYLDKNTGGDEPELPAALGNLAQAYHGLRQDEQALRLIERAIPLVERHGRPNDPSISAYFYIHAEILKKLGRHAAAKAATARAREIETRKPK